ncbi:MAG: sugar ABC transporter substrate-binding protein [Anaerolineaceae bacterium]
MERRKVLSMILVIAMLFGLTACSQTATVEPSTEISTTPTVVEEPTTEEPTVEEPVEEIQKAPMSDDGNPIKIGYMGQSEASQFWKTVRDSLVYYSEQKGIELSVAVTDRAPDKMSAAMDQFIMQGVDFIVDGNIVPELGETFAAQAKEAGIPYLTVDMECGADYFFGFDNQSVGETMAKAAVDMIKDEWNGKPDLIVRVSFPALGDEVMMRSTIVPETLSESIDISDVEVALLELDFSSFTSEKIMQKATDLLNSHPDAEKIAMFGIDDSSASFFVTAAQNLGRGDHVMAFGCDTTDSALQSLCKDADNNTNSPFRGSVNTFVQYYGDAITNIVIRVISGEEVDHYNYTSMELATAENIYDMFPGCTRDFFK